MISIWNVHGGNAEIKARIGERIKQVLELPKETEIQYAKHYSDDGGFKKAKGKPTKKSENGIFRAK